MVIWCGLCGRGSPVPKRWSTASAMVPRRHLKGGNVVGTAVFACDVENGVLLMDGYSSGSNLMAQLTGNMQCITIKGMKLSVYYHKRQETISVLP